MEIEHEDYNKMCQEREWWKSEATNLEKECELNMNEMHQLKLTINSTMNKEYNEKNFNILKKQCHLLYWRRFVEYLIYQHAMEQVHDVWMFLKQKYSKLNKSNNDTQSRIKLKESFKISMFKSLKDIKDLDVDKLLLRQNSKELTDFIISSTMSAETQLKVAAQLLPIVEKYRTDLQKEINAKIDKLIKKLSDQRKKRTE